MTSRASVSERGGAFLIGDRKLLKKNFQADSTLSDANYSGASQSRPSINNEDDAP